MPADTDTLLRQGREIESKLDRGAAIDLFRKALAGDPKNREAAFRLAYHLDAVGQDEESLRLLEQVCDGPDAPLNALINLSVRYEDEGDLDMAERCLRMVLETDANHPRARLYMRDVRGSRTMIVSEEHTPRDIAAAFANTPIGDFDLSTRAGNTLKKMGIRTVGDLLRVSEAELTAYKSLGDSTLVEIKSVLAQRGLRLGQALEQQRSEARDLVMQELTESGQEEAAGAINDSVDELQLSVRASKALALLGIQTLADLVSRTEAELLGIKNFGATSLDEIKSKLAERGLALRELKE